MKRMIFSVKGIGFMSIIMILFFGLSFTSLPQSKNLKKTVAMHTFLVKIPGNAGVCPYQLMMMTNGKLQMADDPHCVCPYQHNSSFSSTVYMTARCTDVNSVRELLPACIRSTVEIKLQDKPKAKLPANLFTGVVK